MRLATWTFVLTLVVALSPWGAYAGLAFSKGGQDWQYLIEAVETVAPSVVEAAQGPSLCHGPSLSGTACHPLSALVPPASDLPVPLSQCLCLFTAGGWFEGQSPQPLRSPPRQS